MAKYVKGRDGKFLGSIGAGKTRIPTAAPNTPSRQDAFANDHAKFMASLAELTAEFNARHTDPNTVTVQDITGFPRTITYGIVDFDAECLFTRGHCHSLALAMHKATGHPIIAFRPVPPGRYDSDGYLQSEDWDFEHDCSNYEDEDGACNKCMYYEPAPLQPVTHFAVLTGPNTILDATGAHPLDTYVWHNSYEPIAVDGANVEARMHEPEVSGIHVGAWLEPNIELGRKFVEAVYALAD
jgi:hypothetical protein